MFNRDQVLTLAYTTAVDPPGRMKVFGNRVFPWDEGDGVEVDIYSIGYRHPAVLAAAFHNVGIMLFNQKKYKEAGLSGSCAL